MQVYLLLFELLEYRNVREFDAKKLRTQLKQQVVILSQKQKQQVVILSQKQNKLIPSCK